MAPPIEDEGEGEDEGEDQGVGGYLKLPSGLRKSSLQPRFRESQVDDEAIVGVRIPSTMTRKDSSSTYTDFAIEVTAADGSTWRAAKRYSEFVDLRKQLEADDMALAGKLPFPKKLNAQQSLETRVIRARQGELEAWLVAILRADRDRTSRDGAVLRRFLDPNYVGPEDDEEDDALSKLTASLACTPASVLIDSGGSILHGVLKKEGKLNTSFQPRFFVLWRDVGDKLEAVAEGADPPHLLPATSASEVVLVLVWYGWTGTPDDAARLPKGIVPLTPGSYTVGVPKRARNGQKHCLRIDGVNVLSGASYKYAVLG